MLEASTPLILVPILWVVGSVAVLGGGCYVITHMVHEEQRWRGVNCK
jgi:hypothetical protein